MGAVLSGLHVGAKSKKPSRAVNTQPTPSQLLEVLWKCRPKLTDFRENIVSLVDRMTPSRDQGQLGTCATFGVVSCLEFFTGNDLSEAGLTHESETETGDCVAGADIGTIMQAAKQLGCVEEQFWRYNERLTCWPHPPDVSARARYRFDSIWLVFARSRVSPFRYAKDALEDRFLAGDPAQAIRDTIASCRVPVAVGVPVFWNLDNAFCDFGWDRGPDVIYPPCAATIPGGPKIANGGEGYHTIAVCGFDDNRQQFSFKNSWGALNFGNEGFGTITYDYVRRYATEAFAGTR